MTIENMLKLSCETESEHQMPRNSHLAGPLTDNGLINKPLDVAT
jgi:hypothetical protein